MPKVYLLMTTNSDIIEAALRDLGVIAETQTPSAEQGVTCLAELNNMMEVWTENGINIGYFEQSSTSDTCPIPKWAEGGVKSKLGEYLAPKYGATVSAEHAAKTEALYGMILRKSLVESIEGADMSHMPVGSARRGGYDITQG